MAVKKTTKKADESAAPTKAEAKETAPKPKAKAAAPKAAAPKAAEAPKKAAAPKAAAPKKAAPAPIKLSPSQDELLKKIHAAGEGGYSAEKKVEERSIDALATKKLVRKGAKDKATGKVPYTLTVAGKKHIG